MPELSRKLGDGIVTVYNIYMGSMRYRYMLINQAVSTFLSSLGRVTNEPSQACDKTGYGCRSRVGRLGLQDCRRVTIVHPPRVRCSSAQHEEAPINLMKPGQKMAKKEDLFKANVSNERYFN